MNQSSNSQNPKPTLIDLGASFKAFEKAVYDRIAEALAKANPGRDPGKCDPIFGIYTGALLGPSIRSGFSSRAAIAGTSFIHALLELEKQLGTEFHKGAIFHDTALAHFIAGNLDEYEYLLAMADEENFKTHGARYKRGTLNLQSDSLTGQTIKDRMQCACELLNGGITGHAAHYNYLVGQPPINTVQLDAWRQHLDSLEQFEFLRIIHDMHQFLGIAYPDYEPVKDNPFVMLRLTKTLAHMAQWIESILTRWQGGGGGSLSPKLKQDADFGTTLSAEAGNQELFAGNCPHGPDVDTELNRLMTELLTQPPGSPRHWRLLRILYIVRNATAHTIDPNLAMYTNRKFLVNLLQQAFVSVFVICQLKGKTMP